MVAAGRFPVLKVLNFFSQIFIISYMRLKLRSLSLLDPKNMPKPIPHCSNFRKIIFLKNGQSYILSSTSPMDNGHFLATMQWRWSCSFTLTLLFMGRGVGVPVTTGSGNSRIAVRVRELAERDQVPVREDGEHLEVVHHHHHVPGQEHAV